MVGFDQKNFDSLKWWHSKPSQIPSTKVKERNNTNVCVNSVGRMRKIQKIYLEGVRLKAKKKGNETKNLMKKAKNKMETKKRFIER